MVAKKKVAAKVAPKQKKDVMDTPVLKQVQSLPRPSGSIFTKALPFVYLALLLFAFGFGVLWQKVNTLELSTQQAVANPTTGQTAQATPKPVSIEKVKELFGKDLIKFGDANKKVLFVEVADPSCPFCHIASGDNPDLNKQSGTQFLMVEQGGTYKAPVKEMKKLVDSGEASFVYIYTPGHGNGEMGQKALYCAYEKGKFWQAHDLLYSSTGYTLQNSQVMNDKTKSGQVADFLKSVVPAADMKACLDSGKYDNRIASDTSLAAELEVFGTPGFFVNTTRYAGAYSFADMESTVNTALGK